MRHKDDPRGGAVLYLFGEAESTAAATGVIAAEIAIATAKLACLKSRRDDAAHAGTQELVRDLAREIAETAAASRSLCARFPG